MHEVLSVQDLLAEPDRFDGRTVTMMGWFVWERENSALYPSQAAARDPATGVWIVHPATIAGERETAALNRGWVRAVGDHRNRRRSGCGHFNRWPAQLCALSELQRVEPPREATETEPIVRR